MSTDRIKERLTDAFIQTYSTGSYSRINITYLCRKAMLNRVQFYSEFDDARDFVRYVRLILCLKQKEAVSGLACTAGKEFLADIGFYSAFVNQNIGLINSLIAVTSASEIINCMAETFAEAAGAYYEDISKAPDPRCIYGILLVACAEHGHVLTINKLLNGLNARGELPDDSKPTGLNTAYIAAYSDKFFTGSGKFKLSRYNVTQEYGERLLIMNTRTGRCVSLRQNTAAKYRMLTSGTSNAFDTFTYEEADKLIKNGILVPEDFDEVKWCDMKQLENVYSSKELSVTLLPTNSCNFNCEYCYETQTPGCLDAKTENAWIMFFRRTVPAFKHVHISWFGGEPLLNAEQTIRIQREINTICKQNGVSMYATMNTNGYELTFDVFKQLLRSHVVSYEVCIDGPRELHNKKRPHKTAADSFSVIVNNLLSIKNNCGSANFEIVIRCNITPETLPYMDEYITEMAGYFGGDRRFRMYFQAVRSWGGDKITSRMVPSDEDSIISVWYDKAVRKGLISADGFPLAPFGGYCDAGKLSGYVLNCDGTVHKCTIAMFNRDDDCDLIGHLNVDGTACIDEGKQARWVVPPEKPPKCENCRMYPLCWGGSCPYQRNILKTERCNDLTQLIKAKLRCMAYKDSFDEECVI